jgi:hypothetical protein
MPQTVSTLRAILLACGLAALSSCGGIHFGSGGSSSYTPYRSFDSGYDRYNVGAPYDPLIRYPAIAVAGNGPASFLDDQLSEYQRAWDDFFDELRVNVDSGLNTVPPTAYLFASRNVERVMTENGPEVTLRSELGDACFITYGLTGRMGDEQIAGISVNGEGMGLGADSGIFLGVRQFGQSGTKWYGPLAPGENVFLQLNEASDGYHEVSAYLTVAVFNGGELKLNDLSIDIGWAPIPAGR